MNNLLIYTHFKRSDDYMFLFFCVLGYEIQNQTCNTFECAVNGTWTQWGGWTNCSADCGDGVQQKERFCEGIVGDGEECPGKNKEFKMCNLKECEGAVLIV